ncbi:SIR2 family protein [Macrococcoides canis]|uniref:SIR2 family protein n=1 Tax=Macrococcoides canis TaxID=1855823 RepID=UPI0020B8BB1E|nr:SIR2 family protein [Macrococcus canis]UTH02874.1 SIR2 family protein [Macrococcus canis]
MIYNKNREIINFINNYTDEIQNGNAAIFAGAGLSVDSGVVSWKELLRKPANEIGLDVDKESNLVDVAQYIYNESNSRNKITSIIKNHIDNNGEITKNHEILSGLPIKTYWTTNYDHYIEKSLSEEKKIVDVKKTVNDLSSEIKNADVTVYKMHGDINIAHEVVLIKDDYEVYDRKNELFTQALRGDLVTKTFLFIGFSFEDPNLEIILSKVRIMLEGNVRQHYCFLRKIKISDTKYKEIRDKFERKEIFKYDCNKQWLKIKDLQRYGIKTILVDEYKEITDILNKIKTKCMMNHIFISGAYELDNSLEYKFSPSEFIQSLSIKLIKEGYKLTSGFGNNVGSDIINGVLTATKEMNKKTIDDVLSLRPFPQNNDSANNTEYRKDMIENCGISIFLYGNKYDDNDKKRIIKSPGVCEEFEIAKNQYKILLPIGATGFVCKDLHEEIYNNFEKYYVNADDKLIEKFKALADESSSEELINNILDFINEIIKFEYSIK